MSPSVREPFVGPRPFDRADASLFFGRERETQDLVSLVMAHRALLLYAPSGAGKSSLLNARVIPELTRPERGALILGPARVSGRLPDNIAPESVVNVFAFHLLVSLGIPPAVAARGEVAACIERLVEKHAHDADSPAVLVIDQFEEVFTRQVDRWKEREPFFKGLGAASEALACLRIVFAMREEYLASLAPFVRFLPERVRAQYRLERLRREAALEAIRRPVELAGRTFAPGAAEELLGNLLRVPVPGETLKEIEGEFVEPVHLQVTCRNVWGTLRSDQTEIDLTLIRAAGSLDVALQEYFDVCVAAAATASNEPESAVRQWIEDVLVTSEGTRNIVAKSPNLTAGMKTSVVEHLETQHVLRAEMRGGAVFFELAHDRFLQPIRRSNRTWRSQQLGRSPELAELEARAAAWIAGGRIVSRPTLFRLARRGAEVRLEEAALQTAERLLANKNRSGLEPSAAVREYFQAHREVHRSARQRLALVYLSVVSTVAVGLLSALLLIGAKYREARAAETSAVAKIGVADEAFDRATRERAAANLRAEEAERASAESSRLIEALRGDQQKLGAELDRLREAAANAIRERDALLAEKQRIEVDLSALDENLKVKQRETVNADEALIAAETRQREAQREADRQAQAAEDAKRRAEVAQNEYSQIVDKTERVKQSAQDVERAAVARRSAAAEAIERQAGDPTRALPALARGVELLADALRADAPTDEVRAALASAWKAVVEHTPLAPTGVTDVEVALDASGEFALAWNSGAITVFDVATRRTLWRRAPSTGTLWSHVEFAPDGRSLLAVRNTSPVEASAVQAARPVDAPTSYAVRLSTRLGETLGESALDVRGASVRALDPRGARVLVAGPGGLRALDFDGNSRVLDARTEPPNVCVLSANGQYVALRFGDAIRVSELSSGRSLLTHSFDTSRDWLGAPQSLAFAPNSGLVAMCGYVSRFFGTNGWRILVHATDSGNELSRVNIALDELVPGWIGFSDDGASVTVVGAVPAVPTRVWRSISFDIASGARSGQFEFEGELCGLRPAGTFFLGIDEVHRGNPMVAWNPFDGSVKTITLTAASSATRVRADAALRAWVVTQPGATPTLHGLFGSDVSQFDARELLRASRALLEGRDEYAPLVAATSDL